MIREGVSSIGGKSRGKREQEQKRFFDEAVLSLPHLPLACRNFDDVFEAMGLQVNGVKSRLLVGEW